MQLALILGSHEDTIWFSTFRIMSQKLDAACAMKNLR